MRITHFCSALLAASVPLGSGLLDKYAKQAGLKYFGAATDSPGQRERAGLEASYAQYDEIMWKSGEFGQTTPTNGMKVGTHTGEPPSHV
jgi:endo-1,4-beta-xylanase